ncbi:MULTISPECIES: hypothetical protein [unclassified Limnohabitans]|jgi:hypothetical protein|uniref:hypothetical protein n=1 Tax=unclassified Limnohabitans TaxID=2626134 RepID=UPI0011B23A92|nr:MULTISPECIES: hypothetical protein [unclassified Limnohabitans]
MNNTNLWRIACVWLLLTPSAYAYVDPGSGMLLWQGLVALIGAVLIFFRNPIQVIKSWIARIRGK